MSLEKPDIQFSGYRILGEIGRGAAAVVYKAEEISLKKTVAIKLLNPALFGDPASVERFIQEARTVARLRHPGIVPVNDLDEFESRLFMVMEFMPGGDLASWVRDHGLLNLRLIGSLIGEVAEALDYAHSQGIVHGDVKPANVLLSAPLDQPGARARLADFGVLRAVEKSTDTQSAELTGTPLYISPEQAEGKGARSTSDQYSLAVMTYELLTGTPPFQGSNALEIYLKHVREAPPRPGSLHPRVTHEIEQVVLRGLEKDPAARYASCLEFARALRAALASTEQRSFDEALNRARQALAGHDPIAARPYLEEAADIQPENEAVRQLLEQVQLQERAGAAYAEAGQKLEEAREKARWLRQSPNPPPDPHGLLARLD
ncbi:serine/threonine-protein kinase, partial [Levilinea saccharolytica]